MTVVAPQRPAERGADAATHRYRPHLDGLRAVAVALVIGFHAGVGRLSGGFIGVDVFFVLSGYLVTGVLLRDIDGGGTVRFGRFYARRMRRLLPAALVAIVATAVIYPVIASPAEALGAQGAARAASVWVANWYFVAEAADYFAADVAANPYLHFWSLSIEEQFYLLWPLALLGLHRLCRSRGLGVLRGVVAALAVASLGAAWWIGRTDAVRGYYGTDTRAYQLLAGAVLALSPGMVAALRRRADATRAAPWVAAAALVALGLLATSTVTVGLVGRGAGAAAAALVLIAALEVSAVGPGRALSVAPLVYLGRISYGIYLWHWIVILAVDANAQLDPVAVAAVATVASTALAALSYHLMEMPVRRSSRLDGRPGAVVAAGLAASIVVGVVASPWLLERDPVDTVTSRPSSTPKGTPLPEDLDWEAASDDKVEHPECRPLDTAACVRVAGEDPHVLLVGDSTAAMYLPALEGAAAEAGFTLSAAVSPGCSWVQGIQRFDAQGREGPRGQTGAEVCRQIQESWYDWIIPTIDPDVVVAVHRPYDDPANPIPLQDVDDGELAPGSTELAAAYERRVRESVAALRAGGAAVVLVEPGPAATDDDDPLRCLSQADTREECAFDATDGPTATEGVLRAVAADDPAVWTLDVDPLVCPALPVCDALEGDVVTRWDAVHLTGRYSSTLAGPLGEALRQTGALG